MRLRGRGRRLVIAGRVPGDRQSEKGVSPESIALAWTLRQSSVVSIPKASNPDHVRANYKAASLTLSDEDCADLDGEFPPPDRATSLAIT